MRGPHSLNLSKRRLLARLLGWMPPLSVTSDKTVRSQLGHDAVQVVRFDLHRRGDLRDRDAGLGPNKLKRLRRAGVATTASARTAGPTASSGGGRSGSRRPTGATTGGGGGRGGGGAGECRTRSPKAALLFLELLQAVVDVLNSRVYKAGHLV